MAGIQSQIHELVSKIMGGDVALTEDILVTLHRLYGEFFEYETPFSKMFQATRQQVDVLDIRPTAELLWDLHFPGQLKPATAAAALCGLHNTLLERERTTV